MSRSKWRARRRGTSIFMRPQIEFLVAAQGGVQRAPALGERRRIEHDGFVLPAGVGIVAQQVEGVGFNPFDFAPAIEGGVPLGHLQGRQRGIDRRHLLADAVQVQGESALVGEQIQGASPSIAFGESVVLALVEKCAALLSGKRVVMKAQRHSC